MLACLRGPVRMLLVNMAASDLGNPGFKKKKAIAADIDDKSPGSPKCRLPGFLQLQCNFPKELKMSAGNSSQDTMH